MIGSQADLDKLHYLKSALMNKAANKIKIFTVDSMSYSTAWEIPMRSYKIKQILISRHLSMINLPTLDKEITNGLMKLANDMQ